MQCISLCFSNVKKMCSSISTLCNLKELDTMGKKYSANFSSCHDLYKQYFRTLCIYVGMLRLLFLLDSQAGCDGGRQAARSGYWNHFSLHGRHVSLPLSDYHVILYVTAWKQKHGEYYYNVIQYWSLN